MQMCWYVILDIMAQAARSKITDQYANTNMS